MKSLLSIMTIASFLTAPSLQAQQTREYNITSTHSGTATEFITYGATTAVIGGASAYGVLRLSNYVKGLDVLKVGSNAKIAIQILLSSTAVVSLSGAAVGGAIGGAGILFKSIELLSKEESISKKNQKKFVKDHKKKKHLLKGIMASPAPLTKDKNLNRILDRLDCKNCVGESDKLFFFNKFISAADDIGLKYAIVLIEAKTHENPVKYLEQELRSEEFKEIFADTLGEDDTALNRTLFIDLIFNQTLAEYYKLDNDNI